MRDLGRLSTAVDCLLQLTTPTKRGCHFCTPESKLEHCRSRTAHIFESLAPKRRWMTPPAHCMRHRNIHIEKGRYITMKVGIAAFAGPSAVLAVHVECGV
jgi:hypothetical protein